MRFLSQLLSLLVLLIFGAKAERFATHGPVLTVTLQGNSESSSTTPWLDLSSSVKPVLQYNVFSKQPPLPNWLPSLKSIQGSIGYQYDTLKRLPSSLEATAKFANDWGELQVQSQHQVKTRRTNLLLQAARGASYAFMKVVSNTTPKAATTTTTRMPGFAAVELLRASVLFPLPFASVSNVRITPEINVAQRDISCELAAVVGARTKAVIHLEYERPTLSVLYAPNDHNLIQPTIDLYNGKMVYQWVLALAGGRGSLQTRVDPVSAIDITWKERSAVDGGVWITDISLPLADRGSSGLAANVRVRRQFQF